MIGAKYFQNMQKDVKLWAFLFCALVLSRLLFIVFFRDRIDASSTASDLLWSLVIGFRYDSLAASAAALPPFLLTITSFALPFDDRQLDRIRIGWGTFCSLLITFTSIVSKYYFEEFNKQIDHLIVNVYYDDTKSILTTIWKEYHVIYIFCTIGLVTAISNLLLRWLLGRYFAGPRVRPFISSLVLVSVLAGSVVIFEPPHTRMTSIITDDDFLNKAAINPFIAIYDAIKEFKLTNSERGLARFLPKGTIKDAVATVYPERALGDDLDAYLQKRAPGARNPPPRHIFLIVMESYSSWTMLPQYEPVHLADNLKALAAEGLEVPIFLPAANNTGESLLSLVTSLPFGGFSLYSGLRTYPSSLPYIFKRLGYRTNFYYGGPLRWQNVANFAHTQGFDAVYGASHMPGNAYANEWGVPDEYLFDFVLSRMDDSQPSFNIIVTTSNHMPFSIDVTAKGFPLKTVPALLRQQNRKDDVIMKILGHQWYSDKCLGSFVRKAERFSTNALFAITGDHPGHEFVPKDIGLFRKCVPFVLYGKNALTGIHFAPHVVGSHIDIGPTLIELAAPKRFEYYSVGTSLLRSHRSRLAIGNETIVGPGFWIDYSRNPTLVHSFADRSRLPRLPDVSSMRSLYNSMCAIGWWRVQRGSSLSLDGGA